ncbi:MAG: hypothetical protein IKN22_04885 [Bacteroidaceae bacterium]|nr:hypothetical protein [Bacteroidaceae bacterium]MBR3733846.1 hypothetical protein [Bacteroidaceae bacterium]
MKKTYLAPTIHSYEAPQLLISISKGGTPVTDPTLVESKKFWGSSLFDDDEEEEEVDF